MKPIFFNAASILPNRRSSALPTLSHHFSASSLISHSLILIHHTEQPLTLPWLSHIHLTVHLSLSSLLRLSSVTNFTHQLLTPYARVSVANLSHLPRDATQAHQLTLSSLSNSPLKFTQEKTPDATLNPPSNALGHAVVRMRSVAAFSAFRSVVSIYSSSTLWVTKHRERQQVHLEGPKKIRMNILILRTKSLKPWSAWVINTCTTSIWSEQICESLGALASRIYSGRIGWVWLESRRGVLPIIRSSQQTKLASGFRQPRTVFGVCAPSPFQC